MGIECINAKNEHGNDGDDDRPQRIVFRRIGCHLGLKIGVGVMVLGSEVLKWVRRFCKVFAWKTHCTNFVNSKSLIKIKALVCWCQD